MTALARRTRLAPGAPVRLDEHDAGDTAGLGREAADALSDAGSEQLASLQERLFAQRRRAVLLVLQSMDAAGKDGAIRRLGKGMNPMGLRVTAFGAPSTAEQAHDFLWRVHRAAPPRGFIGVFNRSHYEDVLVPRVDAAVRARLALPADRIDAGLWDRRLASIVAFERTLADEGTAIVKVFLNVSHAEQRRRLLARLDDPAKQWKHDGTDLAARDRWDDYRAAYEQAIAATDAPHAPWHIVPADRKWFARVTVPQVVLSAFDGLDLKPPPPSAEAQAAFHAARARLSEPDVSGPD